MQSVRRIGVPLDHVAAEVAAFPFASETSLRESLTSLDASLGAATTVRLWRGAERALTSSFPGFSLEEIVAIRDLCWFAGESTTIPLHRILRRLASQVLERTGSAAVPRLPDMLRSHVASERAPLAQARRWWRWLALALPPDLLLAGLHDAERPESGPDALDLMAPPLMRILADAGFAETHLHLGAASEFSWLWVRALHVIAQADLAHDGFASPGAVLDEGRLLAPWLLRAAIARYVLAAFLSSPHRSDDFRSYLDSTVCERLAPLGFAAGYVAVVRVLQELAEGRLLDGVERFAQLQSVYAFVTELPARGWEDVRSAEDVYRLDPIEPLVRVGVDDLTPPEVMFARRGFAYLDSLVGRGSHDPLFERVFWQVLRIRALLYRHVTQRPLVPGLPWFVRFFGRMAAVRGAFPTTAQWELAADICGRDRGLRSLEARLSPWADMSSLTGYLEEVDTLQRSWSTTNGSRPGPPEMCLVLHFSRDRGGGFLAGRPPGHGRATHADPELGPERTDVGGAGHGNPTGYRFARLFVEQQNVARTVAETLRRFPSTLQFVRGLDLCTDELGVPHWVLAPLVAMVRSGAASAQATVRTRWGVQLPPLRTTIHAGEDFVHLLTGLRIIDEAIEQFSLREGDRLGHGIALGVDACDWAARSGRLAMVREDRLWDLTWMWCWSCRESMFSGEAARGALEFEIAAHSRAMFGSAIAPGDLVQLRLNLADAEQMALAGFPDRTHLDVPRERWPQAERRRLELLRAYLVDREVFRRGREVVWVDAQGDGRRLDSLQRAVRAKIGSLGIVVEVNPTSNLLVGDLEDLTAHPLWRLRPPIPRDGDAPPVGICVGSDDPILFNSNLRLEYQCLYDALLLGGLSEEQANQWLDACRRTGLSHRFSVPRAIPYAMNAY